MIDSESNKYLLNQICGALKTTIKDHPELGLNNSIIPSLSKRLVGGISGDCIEEYRIRLSSEVKELLYQEIKKENVYLQEKIDKQIKCNSYLRNKLKEHNIQLTERS